MSKSLVSSVTDALNPTLPASSAPLPTAQTSMFNNDHSAKQAWDEDDGWDHWGNWTGRKSKHKSTAGGYGSYPKASQVYGSPYAGSYNGKGGVVVSGYSTTYTPKKVQVVHDDGSRQAFTLAYADEPWLAIARQVWPGTDHAVDIPKAHASFTYNEPTFNPCVHAATDQYMQARWGRKLDDSDRRWLAAHPLSTDGGVPQEYTATCIAQLVEPYGLKVSRIRIRKNSLVLGDQVMAWLQALGCNPVGMNDRQTSNAEAAAALGMPLEMADSLWRVEFHDQPLPCSIIGERGYTQPGVATGSFGGHARYLAPRARAGDWFISVQLDMDTQVSYLVPPPNPEYVPRKGTPTLQLGSTTDPDGQPIAVRTSTGGWRRTGTPEPTVTPATTQTSTPTSAIPPVTQATVTALLPLFDANQPGQDEPRTRILFPGEVVCGMCSTTCTTKELYTNGHKDDPQVCWDCFLEAWKGRHCPHCRATYGLASLPIELEFDEQDNQWLWECGDCKEHLAVAPDGSDPELESLSCLLMGGPVPTEYDPQDPHQNLPPTTPLHDPDVPYNFID